jgi:hypothetical protein
MHSRCDCGECRIGHDFLAQTWDSEGEDYGLPVPRRRGGHDLSPSSTLSTSTRGLSTTAARGGGRSRTPQRDRTLREALSTSDGFAQELINGIHTNEAGTTDQQNVALRGAAARLRAQIYEPDTQMIWEHIKGLADWGPPYSVNGFVDLSVDALMLWLLTRAHASNRA